MWGFLKPFRSGVPGLLAKLLIGLLVCSAFPGQALAATSSNFVNFNSPVGVAATRDRLFVTAYCTEPRQLYSFDDAGHVSVFATLPSRGPGCFEDYVAVSPGLGGFPANSIYVLQGGRVVQVAADGSSVTTLTTIPGLPADHNGITFDQVGTFGYEMIIAASNGQVWRVSASGAASLVASVGQMLEGPVVAPMSFAPFGGHVIAAAEGPGVVYAISPAGVVTAVENVPSAESVHIIPQNACNFGNSGGAFFSAIYPTHIQKFPASNFTGLGDQLLVTSEGGGIWKLQSVGGVIQRTLFNGNIGQHEGSAFVDCAVPPCSLNPALNWNSPLSDAVPANMPNGTTLPIRFTYGTCSGFIHDESVIMQIVNHNSPSLVYTAWVYQSDITINDIAHLYAQDFDSAQYHLTAGTVLEVQVYFGDAMAGHALINVTP